jgi:PTS system nitrogen regulatory IIA component
MQLTLGDVAGILQTSANNVYRWIHEKNLPAEYVNGQYRFNRSQVLEWATLHRMAVTPAAFPVKADCVSQVRLDHALANGGIIHGLVGNDRTGVIRALVERLPLPPDCDRQAVLQMTLAREAAGSTGIGDGVALPHPRFPIVHPSTPPQVTLAFLAHPVDFAAPDRKPVHALFAIVSPTVHIHLGLLARIAFALRQPAFHECIQKQGSASEIMQLACVLDGSLPEPRPSGSGPAAPHPDGRGSETGGRL